MVFLYPSVKRNLPETPVLKKNQHRGFVSIATSKISFVLLTPVIEIRFFIQFYDS